MEVILGGVQTPAEIAQTALTEDVDMIGFRLMNAAPEVIVGILFDELKKKDIEDIPVVLGGIIPDKDEKNLRAMGVKEIFRQFDGLEMLGLRCGVIAREALERRNRPS